MTAPSIVVVGSSNTDLVVTAPTIPAVGETVLGTSFMTAPGGKGANQAVAAARLGASVTLVARIGRDTFGEQALAGFVGEGLVTDYVARDDTTPSGVALIVVDAAGNNAIAVAPGANECLSVTDVDAAAEAIEAADLVLLQLEIPLETVRHAAKLARTAGVPIILNPAPAQPLDRDLLSTISVLTPNESEAEILSGLPVRNVPGAGRAAARLRDGGAEGVIVTLGAHGALVASGERSDHIPTFDVAAVDSTAAGDAFNGALAFALASGRPLADAVRLANAAGALTVTKRGAQPSLPTRAEVDVFIRTANNTHTQPKRSRE